MFHIHRVCLVVAMAVLAGCQSTAPTRVTEAPVSGQIMSEAPSGAAPGSCWARDASPAVIETVTEQIEIQPAVIGGDGSVISPAIYRTETRQAIIKPRIETVFEIPCAYQMTPELVASLQRALSARRHYRGPVNGVMDTRTRAAVRSFQKHQGLNSGILSMDAARALGLVAQERPGNEG